MSLNPLIPAPVTPPVTDAFRLGTVTQVSPLRVKLDGDTAATEADPINTAGPVVAGDRVWCQLHGKALFVVSSVTSGPRDLLIQNLRAVFAGGGLRKGDGTGVSWSQRFIVLGAGRGSAAPNGFFDIGQPANGTVIPVYGNSGKSSTTVTGGVVPLINWEVLWYDPPLGGANNSQPDRFKITSYLNPFEVPPTWIPVVQRNGDTGTYLWADGRETTPWTYPALSGGWSNYGSGYTSARYKRENGTVYVEGLVKSGTVGSAGIFTLPVGSRPDATLQWTTNSSGGIADVRAFTSGAFCIYGLYTGTNASVSIAVSFSASA